MQAHVLIFESFQLEGLYVGDLLLYLFPKMFLSQSFKSLSMFWYTEKL